MDVPEHRRTVIEYVRARYAICRNFQSEVLRWSSPHVTDGVSEINVVVNGLTTTLRD